MERELGITHHSFTHTRARARTHTYTSSLPSNPPTHPPIHPSQVLSDPKEWRNRLVNTRSHMAKVAALTPETHATVERLADDLERTLAAVRKAEQKLSQQLQGEVAEFSAKQVACRISPG